MALFVFKNKHLGLPAEESTRNEDIIAIIRGVEHRVILRRGGHCHELVDGFTYIKLFTNLSALVPTHSTTVHAIMDRELMPDIKSGKLEYEEIEIR